MSISAQVSNTLSATADPRECGLCPQRLQQMVDVFQSEIDRQRLPGCVLHVARKGRTALLQALGQQDPVAGLPMRTDSIFRIYSMTKPIVSVAVMMLMERGKLLLSDPVSKYIPAFSKQTVAVENGAELSFRAVSTPATVQDLLRHTAGLTYEFLGTSHVQKSYTQVQIGQRARSNQSFSELLAGIPLMYEPGSVWEYSRATDVLGYLIEVIDGRPLGQFLSEEIGHALGMVDTGFYVPTKDHHRIAEAFAHDPDGGVRMPLFDPREKPRMEAGGGGLMSTVADYARFLQFMRNRGELDGVRLLGSRTVDFMTADHLGDIPAHGELLPPGHGFGLGFAVRRTLGVSPVPGSVGLYYWGGIAGTSFFVDPQEDLVAQMMIQAPNQRDYYRPLFRSLVYASLND